MREALSARTGGERACGVHFWLPYYYSLVKYGSRKVRIKKPKKINKVRNHSLIFPKHFFTGGNIAGQLQPFCAHTVIFPFCASARNEHPSVKKCFGRMIRQVFRLFFIARVRKHVII